MFLVLLFLALSCFLVHMPALFLFPSLPWCCPWNSTPPEPWQPFSLGRGRLLTPTQWLVSCPALLIDSLHGSPVLSWVSWGHVLFLLRVDAFTVFAPSWVEESGLKRPSSLVKFLPLVINCQIHQQNPVHCNFQNIIYPRIIATAVTLLCLLEASPPSASAYTLSPNHISHTAARVVFLISRTQTQLW